MPSRKKNEDNTGTPDENITSGKNISYWLDSCEQLEFETLNENLSVDVVIIGGGIAGLTTAYLLAKRGEDIALVEDGLIGSGETGRTTAHISNALDDRYYSLEKYFNVDGAHMAAVSHSKAIDKIEEIVNTEHINCDFERLNGYLFLHPTDSMDSLNSEYHAAKVAGLHVELLNEVPFIPAEEGKSILFPNQGMFHPLKYLNGLSRAIIKHGGRIYTRTHASNVDSTGITTANGFRIKAHHIVVATNTPINDTVVIHTKQAPYKTYVIAAKIPKGSLPHALWWDTGDQDSPWPNYPYHYVRLQNYDEESDLIIIGGEDHKTGQSFEEGTPPEKRFNKLKIWAKKRFPMMQEILYKWSGQVMEPVDALAFIGHNPLDSLNIYIATGDSGNGITHGTIAGMLLTDLIRGVKNKWMRLYSPSRITLNAAGDFIKEQLNVLKQYRDYFTTSDAESIDKLKKGEGAVLRSGVIKAAVFKDTDGELHFHSAICPHLKCIIHWNREEKTFDCPCHGSRFTGLGNVINGPANTNLEPINYHRKE